MHHTHPFELLVAALPKAVVTLPMAEYGQGCAATPRYQFRYDTDKVQVGLATSFDRWANSVDFECHPVPEKQDVFNAFLAVLDRACKEKWKPEHEFGTIDQRTDAQAPSLQGGVSGSLLGYNAAD